MNEGGLESKSDGYSGRRIVLGQKCAYQVISWGKADHCVGACSEVRWVGICSGGGG